MYETLLFYQGAYEWEQGSCKGQATSQLWGCWLPSGIFPSGKYAPFQWIHVSSWVRCVHACACTRTLKAQPIQAAWSGPSMPMQVHRPEHFQALCSHWASWQHGSCGPAAHMLTPSRDTRGMVGSAAPSAWWHCQSACWCLLHIWA